MRDLDRVDPSLIERNRNRNRLLARVLVAYGVHAIAQCDIADVEAADRALRHRRTCCEARASARSLSRSAVASAADVMMSRLPAYAGR